MLEFVDCCMQIDGRDIEVRAEVRTGDTTAAQRQALIKNAAAHSRHHARIFVSPAHFRFRPANAEHGSDIDSSMKSTRSSMIAAARISL